MTAEFGFSNPSDSTANSLAAVKIATTPAAGSLTDNGSPVTAGASVSAPDTAVGSVWITDACTSHRSPYTTFTFQVRDDGGTANGGVDLDPSANTMTVDVRSEERRVGKEGKTRTTTEDTD